MLIQPAFLGKPTLPRTTGCPKKHETWRKTMWTWHFWKYVKNVCDVYRIILNPLTNAKFILYRADIESKKMSALCFMWLPVCELIEKTTKSGVNKITCHTNWNSPQTRFWISSRGVSRSDKTGNILLRY